jgi:hypothetical protein
MFAQSFYLIFVGSLTYKNIELLRVFAILSVKGQMTLHSNIAYFLFLTLLHEDTWARHHSLCYLGT